MKPNCPPWLAAGLLLLGTASQAALPAQLQGLTSGQWRMYEAQVEPGNSAPCCMDYSNGKAQPAVCKLSSDNYSLNRDSDTASAAPMRVYLRIGADAQIDRIRAFAADCPLEAAAAEVPQIELDAAAQLSLLGQLTGPAASSAVQQNAISVLALSAGAPAGDALARLATQGNGGKGKSDREVRNNAVFWLTQTRGQFGFDQVRSVLDDSAAPTQLRKHAVFALSQSQVPARDASLIGLARGDSEQHAQIRGEALFWLAQVSPAAAEPVLLAAVTDPSEHIRERAVFGLSQLPAPRGVALLSQLVADRSVPRETRKQALFWLAQSDAEQALPEVDRLLGIK
jgi:HEAT repeat protein